MKTVSIDPKVMKMVRDHTGSKRYSTREFMALSGEIIDVLQQAGMQVDDAVAFVHLMDNMAWDRGYDAAKEIK